MHEVYDGVMSNDGSVRRVGRPPAASRSFLEEAAAELFLEKGFAATTIADIASRAGVARSTFFNYFMAKSDVLWSGFDQALVDLRERLLGLPPKIRVTGVAALDARRLFDDEIVAWAATVPPENVVMVYTQSEPMGLTEDDIFAAAGTRFMKLVDIIAAALPGVLAEVGLLELFAPRVLAGAYAGVMIVAVEQWARSGGHAGQLAEYIRESVSQIAAKRADSPDNFA